MNSTLTPEQRETCKALAAAISHAQSEQTPAALDAFRAAMRESRERWGDDIHETLKGRAMFAVAGGQA